MTRTRRAALLVLLTLTAITPASLHNTPPNTAPAPTPADHRPCFEDEPCMELLWWPCWVADYPCGEEG